MTMLFGRKTGKNGNHFHVGDQVKLSPEAEKLAQVFNAFLEDVNTSPVEKDASNLPKADELITKYCPHVMMEERKIQEKEKATQQETDNAAKTAQDPLSTHSPTSTKRL